MFRPFFNRRFAIFLASCFFTMRFTTVYAGGKLNLLRSFPLPPFFLGLVFSSLLSQMNYPKACRVSPFSLIFLLPLSYFCEQLFLFLQGVIVYGSLTLPLFLFFYLLVLPLLPFQPGSLRVYFVPPFEP